MILSEKPANSEREMSVVACFLECDGKILLLQRQPHKEHGEKWGLPAGKVENGESAEEALCREVLEETGVRIAHTDMVRNKSIWVRHGHIYFSYHMFLVSCTSVPQIQLSEVEHQGYVWHSPAESLGLDLVEDQDECTRLFLLVGRRECLAALLRG